MAEIIDLFPVVDPDFPCGFNPLAALAGEPAAKAEMERQRRLAEATAAVERERRQQLRMLDLVNPELDTAQ